MPDTELRERAAETHDLPVRLEGRDLVIEIGRNFTIQHVLASVASRHGLVVEDIYVIREGCDEPLEPSHPVHDGDRHHRHHVHHRHAVKVTVNYQNAAHHHDFKRHAALEAVLDWAIGVFGIDAAMAGEFELTRIGNTDELALSEHVGHLAGKHKTLDLNLVRGDIANGADDD